MDKQEYQARVAWLRRYRQALGRQRLLEELLAERRAAAERVGPLLRPGPGAAARGGASGADALPRAVERILAASDELAAQIGYAEQLRAETDAEIRQLPDARQQEILYRRYILGQSFAQIAAALHLEERWVRRLHRRGVEGLRMDPLPAPPASCCAEN